MLELPAPRQLDLPIEIPAGLAEVLEELAFVRRSHQILHDVAEVKIQTPRFDRIDDFDVAERVMRRMVDGFDLLCWLVHG